MKSEIPGDVDAIFEWLVSIPVLWTHHLEIPLDKDEAQPWWCRNQSLASVLASYRSAACWAPYVTDAAWRLPSDHEEDVIFTAVVQEIDKEGKVYDPDDLARVVDALERAAGDGLPLPNLVHASTSGARAIWVLDGPSRSPRLPSMYARAWWALCKDLLEATSLLLDGTGLYVDPAPCDPFRLWRCPFHAKRELVDGKWKEVSNTFGRGYDILTLEEHPWSSFRMPTRAEDDERSALEPGRPRVQPLRLHGPLKDRLDEAVSRSTALQEYFACDYPIPTTGGTNGWNARFRSAYGHVCGRYLHSHPDMVNAFEDLMLDKIERLGGDPEAWRKGRAQYTRRYFQRQIEREMRGSHEEESTPA